MNTQTNTQYAVYSNWNSKLGPSLILDSLHLTLESANQRVHELSQYAGYKSIIKELKGEANS